MGTPLRHISTWHYGQGLSTWASGPGYWYTRSHPNPQNNNCQEEKPTLTRTPAACQLPTSYLLSIRSSPSQSRWSSFRISSWEQPAANSGGTARSFASPRIWFRHDCFLPRVSKTTWRRRKTRREGRVVSSDHQGSEFEFVVKRERGSDMGGSCVEALGHRDWHGIGRIEGVLVDNFLLTDLFLREGASAGFKKAHNTSSGPLNWTWKGIESRRP